MSKKQREWTLGIRWTYKEGGENTMDLEGGESVSDFGRHTGA